MSTEVLDVCKRVKALEVRKKGKPSQARAAFTDKEYERIIAAIESINDVGKRLFLSAIFRYQYNMGKFCYLLMWQVFFFAVVHC